MRKPDENNYYRTKIMAFLVDYWLEHKKSPTIREIGDGIGTSSTSVVAYHLGVLVDMGQIRTDASMKERNIFPTCLVINTTVEYAGDDDG
jgi:SOS-response transcriptional repressor LexA